MDDTPLDALDEGGWLGPWSQTTGLDVDPCPVLLCRGLHEGPCPLLERNGVPWRGGDHGVVVEIDFDLPSHRAVLRDLRSRDLGAPVVAIARQRATPMVTLGGIRSRSITRSFNKEKQR